MAKAVVIPIRGDVSGLDRALRQMDAGVSRAQTKLGGFQRAGRVAGQDVQRLAGTVTKLTAAATGFAAVGLGAGAVKIAKDGIALNAQFEDLNAQFTTLLGNEKKAAKFIESMRSVSADSPLRLTEVLDASRGLLAAGRDAEKLSKTMAAIQNAAMVAGGDTSEKFSRIAQILSVIEARGKIGAEEVNRLSEAGVNVRKVLGKELGLTAEQMANIGKQGIDAKTAIDALTKVWTSGSMGKAAERQSKTFTGQMASITKLWEQLQRLGTENLFSGITKDVLPAVKKTLADAVKIVQRTDIPAGVKVKLVWESAKKNLGPVVKQAREAFGKLRLGERAADAFNAAVPKIVNALVDGAVKAGPLAAKAFASAFSDMSGIARVVTVAALMKHFQVPFFRAGGESVRAFEAGAAGARGAAGIAAAGAGGRGVVRQRGGLQVAQHTPGAAVGPATLSGGPFAMGVIEAREASRQAAAIRREADAQLAAASASRTQAVRRAWRPGAPIGGYANPMVAANTSLVTGPRAAANPMAAATASMAAQARVQPTVNAAALRADVQLADAKLKEAAGRSQMAAAAQREARKQSRAALTAPVRNTLGRISGRGVGMTAAAGVAGVALGGGSTLGSAAGGALVGAQLAGPWGAVGGAIAGAAGNELVKFFKGDGAEAARQLGEEVASTIGKGLSADSQKVVTDLKAAADAAEAKRKLDEAVGRDTTGSAAESRRRQTELGKGVGQGLVDDQLRGKFYSTGRTLNLFTKQTEGMTAAAREAAAKPVIAWIQELEKSDPKLKGAAQRFAKAVDANITQATKNIKKPNIKLEFDVAIQDAAGGSRSALEKALRDQEQMFAGLRKASDVGFGGIVDSARARMLELKVILQDNSGATKAERKAAQKEYNRLKDGIAQFEKDTTPVLQRFGVSTVGAFRDGGAAADRFGEKLRALKPIGTEVANAVLTGLDRLEEIELPAAPPKKKPRKKRLGGLIRAFRGGGLVPAMVSPGEGIELPDGRFGIVPGARVAADSVFMALPEESFVWTGSGLDMLGAGVPKDVAAGAQLPHFNTGGAVTAAKAAKSAGLPKQHLLNMTAIAGRESGWNPRAQNLKYPDHSIGLWQINQLAHKGKYGSDAELMDAATNAKAMRAVFKAAGYQPWSMGKGKGALHGITAEKWATAKKAVAQVGAGLSGAASGAAGRLLGKSSTARPGLVEDAFSQGVSRGQEAAASRPSWESTLRQPFIRGLAQDVADRAESRRSAANTASKKSTSTGSSSGGGTGWVRPVGGPMTSGYGRRNAPTKGASSNHDGIDFGVPVGTPVRSAGAGKVTVAGVNGGYGNYVRVGHSGGLASFYAHLSKIQTSVGANVRRGQTIALSGNTGTSTGPHLHFGMAKNGASVNPASVLKLRRGGMVQRFKGGGQAKAPVGRVGGFDFLGAARGSGQLSGVLARLAGAADEASYGVVEKRLRELQRFSRRGGISQGAMDRVRAALSTLEESLGAKVGRVIGAASVAIGARDQHLSVAGTLARRYGDEGSATDFARQSAAHQRFLAGAPAQEARLQRAMDRAERRKDKAAYDEARAKLGEFQDQMQESSVSLVELGRAAAQAAVDAVRASQDRALGFAELTETKADDAQVLWGKGNWAQGEAWRAALAGDAAGREQWELEAAQVRQQAAQLTLDQSRVDRRAGFADLDLAAARAALTDGQDDDLSVLRQREVAVNAAVAAAEAAGDRDDLTALLQELKGVRDAIEQGNAESKAQTEQLLELEKQKTRDLQAQMRLLEAHDLPSILAGVVSGQIGNNMNATSAFPNGWGH